MAPRQSTILTYVQKAIGQLKAERVAFALRTLETLEGKLSQTDARPKKPNAYAEFVKKQFPHFRKQHPNKSAPDIMLMIAAEWNKVKKATASR